MNAIRRKKIVFGSSLLIFAGAAFAQAGMMSGSTSPPTSGTPAAPSAPVEVPEPGNAPRTAPGSVPATSIRSTGVSGSGPLAVNAAAANAGIEVQGMGTTPLQQAEFARLDVDGDRSLSAAEVGSSASLGASGWQELDRNRDGRLSNAEFALGTNSEPDASGDLRLRRH